MAGKVCSEAVAGMSAAWNTHTALTLTQQELEGTSAQPATVQFPNPHFSLLHIWTVRQHLSFLCLILSATKARVANAISRDMTYNVSHESSNKNTKGLTEFPTHWLLQMAIPASSLETKRIPCEWLSKPLFSWNVHIYKENWRPGKSPQINHCKLLSHYNSGHLCFRESKACSLFVWLSPSVHPFL